MKPTISVVIATFNAEKTLRNCLDSIVRQKDHQTELIVIDGGSTDCTKEILAVYGTGIDVMVSEKDRGKPGEGHVSWKETFDTLKEVGYDGWMVVEAFGLALPETPFGGVKDSGFGHEGGIEGLQVYMTAKFVSHLG